MRRLFKSTKPTNAIILRGMSRGGVKLKVEAAGMSDFGGHLKAAMSKLDIDHLEVAKRAGVEEHTVHHALSNKPLDPEDREKIVEVLKEVFPDFGLE